LSQTGPIASEAAHLADAVLADNGTLKKLQNLAFVLWTARLIYRLFLKTVPLSLR
jgi:hypothetical protein